MSEFQKRNLLRSLTKCEQEVVETRLVGEIPVWLNGTLFRNGPGRFSYGELTYEHLFDGHSCIHKFKIDKGRVYYSNKFLETKSYQKSVKENRLYAVFGTVDKFSTFFERLKLAFYWPETLDNVNVTVIPFAYEKLYALTEINVIYEISSELDIVDKIDINKHVKSATTCFAHPHYLEDGSWLTMGMNTKTGLRPRYEFMLFKNNKSKNLCGNVQIIASLPSSHLLALSYFHSFGLTKNYIIFLEQCLKFDLKNLIRGIFFNNAFSDALVMDKNFKTRIHIINRHTGEILKQKYLAEPLVVFHHINSFEDDSDNSIQIDICAYNPEYFDIKKFTYENMYTEKLMGSDSIKSTPCRIRIPLDIDFDQDYHYCECLRLNPQISFELPVINYYKYNSMSYKYVYGVNYFREPFSIIKLNVQKPEHDFKEFKYVGEGLKYLPSEPIFVERDNSSDEDDGVLLVMVLCDLQSDFLSILDAKSLKEMARAELPEQVRAAFTFHGFFADFKKFKILNNK